MSNFLFLESYLSIEIGIFRHTFSLKLRNFLIFSTLLFFKIIPIFLRLLCLKFNQVALVVIILQLFNFLGLRYRRAYLMRIIHSSTYLLR